MRIVTRPDFDGVVCAALLSEAEPITEPTLWTEPNDMQLGRVAIQKGDIIANLPYHEDCDLWFDHHYTNRTKAPFRGLFRIAPSAAGLVFEYYRDRLGEQYAQLVAQTDKIDSADLTITEVRRPETNDFVMLSMTLIGHDEKDEPYWNLLVSMLRLNDMAAVMNHPEVEKRRRIVLENNRRFEGYLENHTRMIGHVSLTDFRGYETAPRGNRFLVYSMFPESVVNVRVRNAENEPGMVVINVGHSIFNRDCRVNVGLMLTAFGGGGHRGAGSCKVPAERADTVIEEIMRILSENDANEVKTASYGD